MRYLDCDYEVVYIIKLCVHDSRSHEGLGPSGSLMHRRKDAAWAFSYRMVGPLCWWSYEISKNMIQYTVSMVMKEAITRWSRNSKCFFFFPFRFLCNFFFILETNILLMETIIWFSPRAITAGAVLLYRIRGLFYFALWSEAVICSWKLLFHFKGNEEGALTKGRGKRKDSPWTLSVWLIPDT